MRPHDDTDRLADHPTVAAVRQERAKAERHERLAAHYRQSITGLLWQIVDEGHSKRSIAQAVGLSKQRVSQLTAPRADVTAQRGRRPDVGAS